MVGFIKGLFGGKQKDDAPRQPEAQPQQKNGQAYYLNTDEAQSYGNLEYMRTVKKVRRTFPKTVNNAEIELEKEISSMNGNNRNLGTQVPKVSLGSVVSPTPIASNNSATNGAAPTNAEVTQRRKADSSLDTFRNMAKDIRK